MCPTSRQRRFDVVHVSTVHSSGDNRIYRKEATALHEAGVSVAFLSRGPGPSGKVPWVGLPHLSGRLSRMLLGPWHAWKSLRGMNPKVVHLHDPELIPLGLLWKRCTGGAVVYDAHEDLAKQVAGKPYLPRWSRAIVSRLASALESAAARNFDAVVVATPPIARNFRLARRLLVVQNFPWLRDYPAPRPIAEVDPATICYVGGLSSERGSREMCEGIRRTEARAHLTFAGAATPSARSDLASLNDQVTALGMLPAEDVPSVVSSAAIGLVLFLDLPNHREAQPTKLFEYMAAARPFVASDFPYWKDLVGQFECGLFVDPSSPNDIRDAIDELVRRPDTAARLGRRGREALEAHFTFESQAIDLVSLEQDLVVAAGR